MHLTTTMAAAAVAAVSTAVGGVPAASPARRPEIPGHAAAELVQYHSDWRGPRDVEEHRWLHLRQLRAYEEERAAEAARRKASRGEKERAARRAWWDAQRERHWPHNGF
jgi:hypothetical protein